MAAQASSKETLNHSLPLPPRIRRPSSFLWTKTLAVPVFQEDGQRSDAEALGVREVVAAAVGVVGSSDLEDVGGVAAGGDVEVGHDMMAYFSSVRPFSHDGHPRGRRVSRVTSG